MKSLRLLSVLLLLALPLAACQSEGSEEAGATSEATATAEALPATTDSEEARTHYEAGWAALDMGHNDEARGHFEQASAADPGFAMAYYGQAITANSLDTFKANLEQAVENAEGASEAEQLRIEILKAGFENDVDAQKAAADRLVAVAPNSPRAWMTMANVQSGMGDEAGARASLEKAIALDPDDATAHMALGNSLMLADPVDLEAARPHMEKAVEIAPDEAVTHDLLGDIYRAQGMLEEAAAEYGKTAELDPTSGNGYQQRGHVYSFLGDWDQARADYDAAIEIEKGKNSAPAFAVYRALVSVHEGNPGAAVDELMQLVDDIDGMGVPDPRNNKIFALNTAITIAGHAGMLDRAEAAAKQRNALIEAQAAAAGTAAAERNVKATEALTKGWLAARRGNYDAAVAAAGEARTALEPGNDPERFENVHELLGFVSLQQENYDEAIQHYEQTDPDDIYASYGHAMALEGAGRTDEANALYTKIAEWRFNDPDLALVRAEVMEKVGG